ncbi:MAG TPA: sialidase family protein [Candidatus Limnocylindrales bacterium]|nr:sialidase family protein [Candidatus Limnocylindrales bacterium]
MAVVPVATALAVVGGILGLAASNVHLASTTDPYTGCHIGGPGFNSVNAEVEPFVSVNPKRGNNLVGVFQQDRWYDGGSHGVVASFSLNGGDSWSVVPLPFSSCAPGGMPYQRASDPWVSFGPDGKAYVNALQFDETTPRNAVSAATSTDGGRTWDDVRAIITDNNKDIFDDKNSITADPKKAGTAYSVWDRGSLSHNNQPAYFSKTTDGGATWSTPIAITSTADAVGTIGNIVVVDPRNGTLYDVFDNFTFTPSGFVATAVESIIKSTDGGGTWSAPVGIADDTDVGAIDLVTGAVLRTGSGLPDVAIDAKTGQLYVVWEDSRFSNGAFDEVALSTSSDGGATWSTPSRVNKPTGLPAVTPMVAVNSDGTVGVSYYDFRTVPDANFPTTDPSTLPTSYWLTTSPRGGASFNKEIAIITTPFDLLSAANAFGYFVGDYQGLATRGDSFVAFFGQATGSETQGSNPRNRSDIFSRTIGSGDEGQNAQSSAAPSASSKVQAAQAGRAHPRTTRQY